MNRNLTDLVRRFLEYLEIERNCSQLTIRNYKHYLDELCVFLFAEKKLNKLEIDDIGMEEVRRFRLYLSRKKGRNGEMKIVTQGYYIIALRSFLKWLIKN
ncbi:site-specific integrase, partial [Patescibacteria group bacterium]|nr:site-specific integrase [Patescibacteria group bacterium]